MYKNQILKNIEKNFNKQQQQHVARKTLLE